MAILNPSLDTIHKLHQKPESGELLVLHELMKLNNEYEIYFQPYMNGDRPDIVVVRKNGGVLIIEVKNWNLSSYSIDDNLNWRVAKNNARIKESPIDQVQRVQRNFIELHIKGLYQKAYKNAKLSSCIRTCVVFPKHSTNDVHSFIFNERLESISIWTKWKKKNAEYSNPVGLDGISGNMLHQLLDRTWISRKSYLFDDDFYEMIHRHLQCPLHTVEEGLDIQFSKEQKELIYSTTKRQKIKGPAGSGKTLVLAARAVQAHLKTQSRVLILTFNITLINYIRDRIKDIPETFNYSAFDIANYHNWFKGMANKYGISPQGNLGAYDDQNYFEGVKDEIERYDSIFIDEVQDYKEAWLYLINGYFLKDDGEFVVFGDEKQNIYDLPLDANREPRIPTVPGSWNRSLKTSFRFVGNLSKIASDFQRYYFHTKYNIDDSRFLHQPELDFTNKVLQYFHVEVGSSYDDYMAFVNSVLKDNHIHPGDLTILSADIEFLRGLEQSYRRVSPVRIERMHETQEEYDDILRRYPVLDERKYELTKLRRNYKRHFYAKSGLMKFSTVHSFKGWESDSIILIITKSKIDDSEGSELVYTGLTRAKQNLIIINAFDDFYHSFFSEFEAL